MDGRAVNFSPPELLSPPAADGVWRGSKKTSVSPLVHLFISARVMIRIWINERRGVSYIANLFNAFKRLAPDTSASEKADFFARHRVSVLPTGNRLLA
jgi:hypothetical protein